MGSGPLSKVSSGPTLSKVALPFQYLQLPFCVPIPLLPSTDCDFPIVQLQLPCPSPHCLLGTLFLLSSPLRSIPVKET